MTKKSNDKNPTHDAAQYSQAQVQFETPEDEFGFSIADLQNEVGNAGRLTFLPPSLVKAFAARGYVLQYVNYDNQAYWARLNARTQGAVRPVSSEDIAKYTGSEDTYGLVLQKTEFAGKTKTGVVRAGEMVLVMIPTAVASVLQKEVSDRTSNYRKQIYGSTKERTVNKFVREDVVAQDGTRLVQTVLKGPGGDPFAAKDYNAGMSFGD
jgi:hypothetical protein